HFRTARGRAQALPIFLLSVRSEPKFRTPQACHCKLRGAANSCETSGTLAGLRVYALESTGSGAGSLAGIVTVTYFIQQRLLRTFGVRRPSEPMLNVPPVVTTMLVALGLIHAIRAFLLSPRANADILLLFAFIPARYDPVVVAQGVPGGLAAQIWTFVS